jgi:hypothetical protein
MHATANRPHTTLPSTLASSILSGCLVGIAVAALYTGIAPAPSSGFGAVPGAGSACRACGVVEQIRKIENPRPRDDASTVVGSRDESIVMLLVALGGATLAPPPASLYEVSVRMADGTLRAIRGDHAPRWQPGDLVKVVKGELEARTTR